MGIILLLVVLPPPSFQAPRGGLSSVLTVTGAGRERIRMGPSTASHISLGPPNPIIPFDTGDNEFTYSLPVPEPFKNIEDHLHPKGLIYNLRRQARLTSTNLAGADTPLPISITGDSDFALQGWPGAGTP